MSILKSHNPLVIIGLIEFSIFAACILAIAASTIWHWRMAQTRPNRVAATNEIVQQFLDAGMLNDEEQSRLKRLSMRQRIELLATLSSFFRGTEGEHLHALANQLGLIGLASRRCKSLFWSRRLQGIRLFTLCGGGENQVPFLLNDRREEVRAGAAEWAANHPTPDVIRHLLSLLGDNSAFCRFTVKDSLLRLGPAVTTDLANYLEANPSPSAESLEVAAWIVNARFLPAGIRLSHHSSPAIRARSMDVLSSIGGEQAAGVITKATSDTEVMVRISALRGLARMGHWQAAAETMKALSDTEWDVRKQAGLTLRSFEGPGILLLRRTKNSEDRFAADMARHILDMPSVSRAWTS